MTKETKVPVEPGEQTKLLDECLNKKGTIAAGVPGGSFCASLPSMILILTCISSGRI